MKRIWTGSLAVLALGIVLTGCNAGLPTTASNQTPTAVAGEQAQTATVKRQDVTGYSFFSGKLVVPPDAQATAFSPFDTSVEAVPVNVGTHVLRGQTVVKLTIPGADEAANAAKANVKSAEATYSQEKASVTPAVQQAQQALDEARANEKSARDVAASGGSADVDAATQARITAEENLAQAKAQANQSLQPTKTAIAQSAAQLAAIRADARKGIVRAPISGTLVRVDASPGMAASANQVLATVVNFSEARVEGTVPPDLKDEVTKGTRVTITLGASTTPVSGRVEKVTVIPPPGPSQPSPGYLAVIRFTDPDDVTRPDVAVKSIGVQTGSVKDALVVPVGAITQQNGHSYVKVQRGNSWVSTPVETGLSDGVVVEIKSGLNEGDVVQVVGQQMANG